MKIAVLGGGISGLSAGWRVRKRFPHAQIELYEKTGRLGGWIETTQAGPFLFERGPRTFQIGRSKHLLQLIEELGLSSELLFSETKATRYLWTQHKLRSLHSFWPILLKGCMRDLLMPRGKEEEETVESFFTRRFGPKFTQLFVDSMVTGVFGGKMARLSAQACFSSLTQGRSVIMQMMKGPKQQHGLFTLRSGMERIIEPLAKAFDAIHFHSQQFPEADQIIAAVPAHELSTLLHIPLNIPLESFSVVNLGFLKENLLPQGYGYLIPSLEQDPVMGMIWDSSIFPVLGQTKITAMVRSKNPVQEVRRALWDHLGIAHEPDAVLVKEASIPQYEVGHNQKIQAFLQTVQQTHPHVVVMGNWLQGPSVDQCISMTFNS